jgi:hypothetical protein
MALTASEVVVAGTGHIYVAPVGTTAPATPVAAWGTGWVECGYTSDDGVSLTPGSDANDINVWQDPYPVRRIINSRSFEIGVTLAQWNQTTVVLAFGGGSITTTTGPPASYKYDFPTAGGFDERAMGVEWTDGSTVYRLIVPRGAVTDLGDVNLSRGDNAGLEITYSAFASSGVAAAYILTNAASFAALP